MSSYWKKKLEELEGNTVGRGNSSSGLTEQSSYWQKKLEELEEQQRAVSSSIEESTTTQTPARKATWSDYWDFKAKQAEARSNNGKTTDTQDQKRTWFQAGALDDDGSTAENVAKTVLGTTVDVKENAGAGVLGLGEKLIDTLATIGAYQTQQQQMQAANSELMVRSLMGESVDDVLPRYQEFIEETKEGTAEFVAKDLYDEKKVASWLVNNATVEGQIAKAMGVNAETDSVLGDKSDGLVQSAGQLGAQIGLSALGVPWWLTSGVSAFGGEVESASREGATLDEATMSGFISAGAEILTERISGGIKIPGMGGTLDDALTRTLATEISSKFWRTAAKMGIDIVGEGLEEVASSVISEFGQWLTYRSDEELNEILWSEQALEEKLEAFIGGSVLAGFSAPVQAFKANAEGKDYTTGLTEDEFKVADKVYREKVEQDSKNGKKTTFGKKNAIYERVQNEMEKGFIPAEKVEEILGGESYTAWKSAQDSFFGSDDYKAYRKAKADKESLASLTEEYTKLFNMKRGDMTGKQLQREADLKKQIEEIANSTTYKDLRAKLSPEASRISSMRNAMRSEVMNRVKGSKLAESYAELARRDQKFTADVTKYTDENARKTVETILASGIGDNTTQFHETVDFLARVSEHTGQIFDFTKDELLKGTEHYQEGYVTNGFVSDDGKITLNWDSKRALNVTVGHEITHVLEKAGAYKGLREAVFNYAISKEGKAAFNARLKAAEKAYSGKTNTTAEAEVAADLIGEYLFSDYDFVNNLSKTNQDIFMRMFDEVKHLYKMATAGSKEAIELEKVRYAFQQAYNENVKGKQESNAGARTKSSLSIKYTDGSVEELADARSLTSDQAVDYLYKAKAGKIRWDSYIPVRKDTPQVIIDALAQVNDNVENRSLVMQVKKAQQSMSSKRNKRRGTKYGNNIRSHDLTPEQIAEIVNNLDDPSTIIYQTNRRDDNGNKLPNNVAVFVEYMAGESEGMAVIEFEPSISSEFVGKEYGDTGYHTVVTVFEPDVERDGIPYDHAEDLLSNPNNYELKIEKRQLEESAIGKNHPNTFNELPSNEATVSQNKPVVKNHYSFSSIANSFFGNEEMSTDEFLADDYHDTEGYKEYVEQCLNNMRQSRTDFNEDFAKAAIQNSIDGIVRVAVASKQAGYDIQDSADKRDVRDSKKRLLFSSLEPNSDYFTSHDISTICDKRKNFAEIYDEIVRLEESKGVPKGKRFFDNVDNYFAIHEIMAEKGLTTPCRQCYVESMRKNLAPMATAFLELVKETNPDNTSNAQLFHQKGKNKGELKTSNASLREAVISVLASNPEYNLSVDDLTIEMLTTADGLAQLRIQAPLIYEAFNSFYGQAKPKMPKQATPFRFGELTALLTDNNGKIKKSLIEKINSTGGFRLQSYSDFQIQNYVDVLQVLFEAGTLGLNGHAYTKVPAFLDATEGTNLKRNISIFMYKDGDQWKLDRNDSFPDTLDQIYERVKADKTGNTSIIAVSQNADMSAWIMANDYVGYGIPFHKSGLKMGTVRDTVVKTEDGREVNGYTGTKDHTKQQTEVWKTTTADHKANTKVKTGINIYSFWDFENKEGLSKKELIEKNLKNYINQCELAGYLPKFREYVMDNDKVLNNVLKYAKELGFVGADATINDISFEYMGYRIPYGYYKFLGDFGMFTPDGSAAPQQTLSLEGYNFDKAVNFFSDAENLRREEILQQFSNGKERQEYRSSTLTAEELEQIAKRKRQEVAEKATKSKYSVSAETDSTYMDAVNRGDMDIAQEFVDDAAMSAGYDVRMFHETDADNIHIFDISRGTHGGTDYQTPYGIFTKTSSKNIGLGSKQMSLFVKARNTLRVENRDDVVNKVPGFAKYYDQITEIDKKYDALANELEDEEFDALMEWMEEHPDADMDEVFPNSYIIENKPADIDSEKYLEAHSKRVALMNEWSEKYNAVAVEAKAFLTNYLRSNGYDSMYFVVDGGSRGRQTDSLIVLDENQVKSADPVTRDDDGNVIPLSKRFNQDSKDTRYSMSPEDELPTEHGNYHVYSKDFGATDPLDDFDIPVRGDMQESFDRESFDAITDADAPPEREDTSPEKPITTVQDKLEAKINNTQAELDKNRQYREQALNDFDEEIDRLQKLYDSKKNKNTRSANGILRSIERLKRLRANTDADYSKRISDLEARVEKMSSPEYRTAEQRRSKMQEHTDFWETLLGDTSTWKDMALGIAYKTKTLRRILRTVVKDANGKPDIAKADAIYDALETKYDHNEAQLKKESVKLKEVFKKLDLNSAEDTYAHMLGEFRHNPQTTLTEDQVNEYYEKHKNQIDVEKVNSAITEARKTFDELIVRVNQVLREQGMKEIPYRQGYFPHFTNPKQNWVQKLFNWKPVDNEIPTSIAGITEMFDPQRSWQGFNKQRKGDKTDYSLYQGLDTYIHGALDWIYHIDDLQSRRALENYIRYVHSEEGKKARIDEIKANESYDADEAQAQIDAVLAEANNPLNNLVTELRARTNALANKKSSMDRGMEEATNRKIYSTMTNLNNRINANMVVGSISSALTNFIPITQSWVQVNPKYSLIGLRDFLGSTIKDDGMVAKSDFLTNRLVEEEKLYQTGWDKAADKAAWLMNVIDNISSQTVWRSKYLQNIQEGMSEAEAIKDADQFAKNVIAGRSRGNMPTIFDSKNPLIKMATAFQLEVANQYGFMFEDTPQDVQNKARLVKGYATAFIGAYVYNALYSSLVGRDAAFDPISIIEDLLRDLFGDDEEEPEEFGTVVGNLAGNIVDELPFVSGFTGGGRIPLSSALPYGNDSTPFESLLSDLGKAWNDGDVLNGDLMPLAKEVFLKPLYYLALPFGGGQLKKTNEGLAMFDDDLPVSGSYTESGNLRYPVEDTFGNKVQAALFGQYASKNARDYFDNDRSPLGANQIKEYQQLDIPIRDYWEIREGLAERSTTAEKIAYIGDLDLPIRKQNTLANNIVDRKTPIDMTDWDKYASYEEFDFAEKNPEKYDFLVSEGVSVAQYNNLPQKKKDAYDWAFENPEKYAVSKLVADDLVEYREYATKLNEIRADKTASGQTVSGSAKTKKLKYINGLNIDYGAKLVLFKTEYPGDNTYNRQIVEYVNSQSYTLAEKAAILRELGFTVTSNGTVTWK